MARDNKMGKREFLKYVAKKNGVTVESLTKAYDMIIGGICDIVLNKGIVLTFVNFGKFYTQKHKGHFMQFSDEDTSDKDYMTFKFSAARSLNRELTVRELYDKNDNEVEIQKHDT